MICLSLLTYQTPVSTIIKYDELILILSQQNVESLVSSGAQKAIKETGQGRGGRVNANENSLRRIGRVLEKRPVYIRFDVIMVPLGWALRTFCYFKMPFAFLENHKIGSLALSALGWYQRGTSVNYELQVLSHFIFVCIKLVLFIWSLKIWGTI